MEKPLNRSNDMKRFLYIIALCYGASAVAQPTSPFNGLAIAPDSTNSYTFFVGGHFYGGSADLSGFPAATLLGNLDTINNSDAAFMICLGDLFLDINKEIPTYERILFPQLEMPLFNAVGNHDVSGTLYRENYGDTWMAFNYHQDQFILLDTEEDNGDIEGAQLEFLKQQLNDAIASDRKNIFVFAHRPLWTEAYPEMENVFEGNTQSAVGNNFATTVLPLLEEAQSKANIYWFGGSMGGKAPVSFFYHKVEGTNIHYLATAIRNLKRDAILKLKVSNGAVTMEPFSLTGQSLQAVTTYNLNFWTSGKATADEGINYKLIPLWVYNTVTHRYFWYGVLWCILLLLGFKQMKKRFKRNKS